jgi:hypothetical protein
MARKVDTKEFIRMAKTIHGNNYDYSKTIYTRSKDSLIITCPIHGDFIQRASNHLSGSGCPKCFQDRNGGVVCGVGIQDMGQSDIHLYTTWRGMLFRCYDKKYNSSYEDCEVCDDWKIQSNFAKWYYANYKDGYQLDKDILGNGKLYSPQTCCFIPSDINMCIVGKNSESVTFVKGKWQSSFSQKYIGRFDSKQDAINAYRKKKGEHIKKVAAKYKDDIPEKVYNALIQHALRLCKIEKEIIL